MLIESFIGVCVFAAIILLTVAALLAQAREDAGKPRRSAFGRVDFN